MKLGMRRKTAKVTKVSTRQVSKHVELDFDPAELTAFDAAMDLGSALVASSDPFSARDGVDLISRAARVADDSTWDDNNDEESFEQATKQELGDVLKDMKAHGKRMAQQFQTNTDIDYFTCVVFLSHEQKEAFLRATGWDRYGGGTRYINGLALARELGVELPPAEYKPFEPIVS